MKAVMIRNWHMYKRYFPIVHFFDRVFAYACTLIGIWLMNYILFGGFVKANVQPYIGNIDYFTYATMGIIIENIAVSVLMNVSRAFIMEVREGTLQSLMITPFNKFVYHVGILFEQIWRMVLETIILLFIAQLLGAQITRVTFYDWFLVIPFVMFISFCMGIVLSNVMLQTRDTYISQNFLFSMIFFICGITFPIEIFPPFLRFLAYAIPLTQALEIFRILSFMPQRYAEILPLFFSGVTLSFAYLYLGLKWYKATEGKIISYTFE